MDNAVYLHHLDVLLQRYKEALSQFKLDAIVVASGALSYYYHDDNSHPFKPYAGAQQWLPFALPANCYVVIKADQLELIWPAKQDFWHMVNAVPEGEWQSAWQITPVENQDWVTALPTHCALIGPASLEGVPNLTSLETWLDFYRAVKTDYEIECLSKASHIGAAGHKAASDAFLAGASEFEVHLAYLNATRQDAAYTPYPNIIGINEHAAVLHYEQKDHLRSFRPLTLLVDAGATYNGFASDITRTTLALNDDFKALHDDVNTLQQRIANQSLDGQSFIELHDQTVAGIADILRTHDLCSLSVEEQIAKRIPQHFYPHGLGHLLGLQVHDIGGRQINHAGDTKPSPAESPFLRLTRTLQENMVITIEPGLYFIPMLLNQLKADVPQHGCNLAKIDKLLPYGGIRIEDNVVVGKSQIRNLTREAFDAL